MTGKRLAFMSARICAAPPGWSTAAARSIPLAAGRRGC